MKWTGWPRRKLANRLPNRIDFEITQQDIERGVQLSCTRCPGALALVRWFAERGITRVRVEVLVYMVMVTPEGKPEQQVVYCDESRELRDWIMSYDRQDGYRSAVPGKFTLTRWEH